MKKLCLCFLLIGLMTVFSACGGGGSSSSGGGTSGGGNGGGNEYEYGLKDSAIFDPTSGSGVFLGVTDAKGYTWKLLIPNSSLLTTETITMTALDAKDLGTNVRSGVKLEPDGLYFSGSAQLSCVSPDTISNPEVILIFNLNDDGSFASFAPVYNNTYNNKNTAMASIRHFSKYGTDNSSESDDDIMDAYRADAENDYNAAKSFSHVFLMNGAPDPPAPPSIDQFCRCKESGEVYKFTKDFISAYEGIALVLLSAAETLQLLNPGADISSGMTAARAVMEMAHTSIINLGKQYQNETPPDHLYAVIAAGLYVERVLATITGSGDIDPLFVTWSEKIRNYYLDQLKTNHDYRAFPTLLTLNKNVLILGGSDRQNDIMSAMTFEVTINTYFETKWYSSNLLYADGQVSQSAIVKDLKNELMLPDLLWGTGGDRWFTADSGKYNTYNQDGSPKSTLDLTNQQSVGTFWLMNWDPCVKKSFDAVLSNFIDGTGEMSRIAGAAAWESFQEYWWAGNSAYLFPIPMDNKMETLGSKVFTVSGSSPTGNIAGSGEIAIWIKHTPK
jgi:hypothetical protein